MRCSMRLTEKKESKCKVTYNGLAGCMNAGLWDLSIYKRDMTRIFYEGVSGLRTGWESKAAQDMKMNDKNFKPTFDHVLAPQTTAYFICDNWDRFQDFEEFRKIYLIASQVCAVTSYENNELKKWTGKDSSQVLCPINERYNRCGIRLYHKNVGWNDTHLETPFHYPFEVPEGYLEYEAKTLLQEEGA